MKVSLVCVWWLVTLTLVVRGDTPWTAAAPNDAPTVAAVSGKGEVWTLDRAIATALANNPSARIARHRLQAAQALIRQADSFLWPKGRLETSYQRTDNPMLVFGSILNQRSFSQTLDFNHVPEVDNVDVRGVVSWPLYAGGAITAQRRAARSGAEAAKADQEAIRRTLAFEVTRAFHNVLKTREFIRAAEAAVRAFEANAKIATHRYQAGTLVKAELLDVQVRLAQARENLVRARNAHELSRRVLANLLGVTQEAIQVADTAPQIAEPPADAQPERPELQALQHRVAAAEAAVQAARAGHLPRVALFGSGQYDYGFETEGDGASWSAGAMIQWDLWDGFLTRGRVQQAHAALEAAREQLRQLRQAIDLEIARARLQLREARERVAVTSAALTQAEQSVQLTRARFEQGLALATQLIDAETALTAARVTLAEARTDAQIAVAALRHALGLPLFEKPLEADN